MRRSKKRIGFQNKRTVTLKKMKKKTSTCSKKEIPIKLRQIQSIDAMTMDLTMMMTTLNMKTINSCAPKRSISGRLSSKWKVSSE
jgi:hypothetical protein